MEKVTFLKSDMSAQGGLEKYTLRLAEAFAKKGYSVKVLTTSRTDKALPRAPEGVELISLASKSFLSAVHLLRFDSCCQKWLKSHPSQIVFGMDHNRFQTHYRAGNGVHAAYLHQRALSEPALKRFSLKINPLHKLILSFEKSVFEHPELKTLFTNSHLVKEQILSYYSTAEQKIEVVHNGVEWNELKVPFESSFTQKNEIRRKLGLDADAFHFLFIGHGYHRKGLMQLLNSLALLQGDFQLSVVGKDRHIAIFQKIADRLFPKKKVHFFGAQSCTLPFYQMADCLVVPSLYDPFANVTVEAQAMGLYVISSKYNGGHEILKPFSGAVIEQLFNKESFANELKKAMAYPKVPSCASLIREGAKELDFSNQLEKIISHTISHF